MSPRDRRLGRNLYYAPLGSRGMVERPLPHKHCRECGTSIGVKDEYCSKECRTTHDDRIRGKKRQLLWLYFGGVALFGVAMLMLFGGG